MIVNMVIILRCELLGNSALQYIMLGERHVVNGVHNIIQFTKYNLAYKLTGSVHLSFIVRVVSTDE